MLCNLHCNNPPCEEQLDLPFHWAFRINWWENWKKSTVLCALFNLNRFFFSILLIENKFSYLDVPPLGAVLVVSLCWARNRNEFFPPTSCSFPGNASCLCLFWDGVEQPKVQNQSRTIETPGFPSPHGKLSLFCHGFQTHWWGAINFHPLSFFSPSFGAESEAGRLSSPVA